MIRVTATPVIERGSIVEHWQLAVLLIRAKFEWIDAMRELEADVADVTTHCHVWVRGKAAYWECKTCPETRERFKVGL